MGHSDKGTFDEDSLDDEMKCRECLKDEILEKKKKQLRIQSEIKYPTEIEL